MYALAISFETEISGQEVITQAQIQEYGNRFDCLIFHDRHHLYSDFNPVHRMQHGDSLVVHLSRRVPADSPEIPLGVMLPDPDPEPAHSHDVDMHSPSSASFRKCFSRCWF